MSNFVFTKATKRQARLRMALIGPAGSGKTFSALRIAQGLVPGGRIAVIDTERGSASKYADRFAFDVLELTSFSPDTYVEAIAAAVAAQYDAVIIDSLSHAWMGRDGALEQVDKITTRSDNKSSFNAWRSVTPRHNRLVDALISSPLHLFATMRTKTEYVLEKDERTGKTVPKKIGLAPVQRDGLEYEFDVVGDLDAAHRLTVTKTRCSLINDAHMELPDEELGRVLSAWLSDGSEAPIVSAAVPAPVETERVQLRTLSGTGPADPLVDPLRAIAEAGEDDARRLKAALAKLPAGELRDAARKAYYERFPAATKPAEGMKAVAK